MKIPFFPHTKTIAFSLLAESLQFHNNSVLKEILNKKNDFFKKCQEDYMFSLLLLTTMHRYQGFFQQTFC